MASLPTPSSHLSGSVDVNSVPFMTDTRELSRYLHGRVQEISKRLCDRHCSWNSASMNRKTELETDPALQFLHECDMSSASGKIASIAEDFLNTIHANHNHNPSTELDLENYMLVQNPWKKKMMEGIPILMKLAMMVKVVMLMKKPWEQTLIFLCRPRLSSI